MANINANTHANRPAAFGPVNAGGGTSLTYRMRADDGTLGYPVYWDSAIIDGAGVNYSGPGPLTDVVVSEVIGG